MKLNTMSEKSESNTKLLKNSVDKDARLRILKEKQNEDKQRKLEEIKAQAFAAQKFKEQKEQERRQRLEEMRIKEDIRRQQVEERKRAINDAERDRLESIIRKNQQREIRLEARKRNERSNLVFAFGSSTPRNLDPHDLTSSFWGQRRATSTQNITVCSNNVNRRCTERDSGKKRASSAGGIDRAGEGSLPATPAGCVSGYLGRRRTDLMPTIPSTVRDSRKSQSPGRAYSMTRLDQLAKPRQQQQQRVSSPFRPLSRPTNHQFSVTRSMSHLAGFKTRTTQTGKTLNKTDSRSMDQLSCRPMPRTTRATQLRQSKLLASSSNSSDASSRPSSSMSTTSSVSVRHRPSRKPRPASIAITGVTAFEKKSTVEPQKPPLPKKKTTTTKSNEENSDSNGIKKPADFPISEPSSDPVECRTEVQVLENVVKSEENAGEMTASQIKAKIQTEEEAKAALAERRRLAKEEAARRAEEERVRIETEQKAELERQLQEEEQVRLLIEAQRIAEEQRLNDAIQEARKKEEEERQKREEEERLRALKEESDRKARLEAEKQKAEQQERLMKEEKEREARRKRVEAIMLRTRGKQNANQNEDKSDNSKMNGTKIEEQSKEERVDNLIEDQSNSVSLSTDSMNNLWQSTTQHFVLNNNT